MGENKASMRVGDEGKAACMLASFSPITSVSPPRDEREGQRVPEASLCPLHLSTPSLTVGASLFYKSMVSWHVLRYARIGRIELRPMTDDPPFLIRSRRLENRRPNSSSGGESKYGRISWALFAVWSPIHELRVLDLGASSNITSPKFECLRSLL